MRHTGTNPRYGEGFIISQKIFVSSKNGPIPDSGFLIAQNEKIYIQ
jgi:hypothetical protein